MPKQRILDVLDRPFNIMQRNAILMGCIQGQDNYVAHGEIYGDSDIQGVLLLAEDCHWHGDISADVVIVKGRVHGNITAGHKLELRDYCQVYGAIAAPIIAISHLAKLRGEVELSSLVSHFPERRAH